MQEHKITKEDGTNITWTSSRNNSNYFCLLYSDNKQKFKFTPNENLNCELFMIGGGGAGGYFFGGGGGAGASYINNNYTFKKNKTYTFEIGNGGMCDIADINKLFKSGLTLNIYNNTTINLLNINFTNDDYSSLGIQSSGMMQSFNVNNITIPSSIFHNNTTYIWDGYIKTNSTGYFNVNINSKIKTIIWFDKFVYNNTNALIEGNNITDVKIIQLESNRFYNIKIIAYNDDNNSNNFNITFEGCQLFNFDKNEEKYVYIPATDTSLTYRNDDNTFETIRCKGGGNGGCGFFNKNTNLDGGCGGGSGINKIKGSSIIGAIYNGYDGAVGDYCGGGGGIMSAGRNNIGGDGKIINWFNETLIFGAGGNAAKLSETRNLGYGCGGNGGECCYYSKLLINNNGNNGCILIYVKSSETFTTNLSRPRITEGFANKDTNMLPDDSIAKKLIEKSFAFPSDSYTLEGAPTRSAFFAKKTEDIPYLLLIDTITDTITKDNTCANSDRVNFDNFLNQTFIYDMLVISKLYAIIYRLYWYQYNYVFNGDLVKWKDFCNNAKIKFTSLDSNTENTKIDNYTVYINNLFTLTNLKLSIGLTKDNYKTIYTDNSSSLATGSIAMSSTLIDNYIKNFTFNTVTRDTAHVPLYHNIINGDALKYLKDFNDNEITYNRYYKIVIGNVQSSSVSIDNSAPSVANCLIAAPGSTTLNMQDASDSVVTRDTLKTYHDSLTYSSTDSYKIQRAYIYFEALNVIFNTDSTSILANLNYNMHYYNLVVYNASILYGMVSIQKNRFTIAGTGSANTANCYSIADNGVITRNANSGTSEFKFTGGTTYNNAAVQDTYVATITTGAVDSIALKSGISQSDKYVTAPDGTTLIGGSGLSYTTAGTPGAGGVLLGAIAVSTRGSGYKPTTTCSSGTVGPTYDITTATANPNITNLNDDLIYITSNIQTISGLFIKTDDYTRVTSNITNVSTENTITSTNFYNNQQDLNKTINEYNGELENFNNISFYYKLVVAFALLLTIVILFIFGTNRIDNNSKISVYVIIIVMIIIAFILYKQFSLVKEGFTYVHYKTSLTADSSTFAGTAIPKTTINKYKISVERYINNLILSLTNSNIATNLNSSLTYIKKISVIKNEKAEIYKIKKMNLMNSIEILKKNANFYYYMIIAIFVSIIILNIGLILYLLNPAMVMQIVILCIIPFIVLIYYISYYIHKSTRLAENKNYWANYNPSSTTLEDL